MKQAYPATSAGSLLLLTWLIRPAFAQAQPCVPATVTAFPYVENFDGVTAPALPCGVMLANVNTDASTWATIGNNASSAPNAVRYNYSNTNNADDWFFTPALQCRAGATYQVQFKYRATLPNFPEALEVRLGRSTTPSAAQTTLLFSNANITNTTYLTSTAGTGAGQAAPFTPSTTGIYYVSFRSVSPANSFYLYLDDVSITEAAPLPVQLTAFTAKAAGLAAAQLSWTTATELNSSYFEVERSFDGASFASAGRVLAAGSSPAARTYTFTDTQPLPRLAYYRLRQVDQDGTATYSPVRTVTVGSPGLALYPNPAPHAATLSGAAPGSLVRVYDALGRAALTTQASEAGTAELVLPAGLYLVRSGAGPALRLAVE